MSRVDLPEDLFDNDSEAPNEPVPKLPARKRFVAARIEPDSIELRTNQVPESAFEREVQNKRARKRQKREAQKQGRALPTIPDKAWEKACESAAVRLNAAVRGEEGCWGDAQPREYVAAYALLHERVYGILPYELTPIARLRAAGLAKRLLDTHFDGDGDAMGRFILWAWKREKEREDWRRKNPHRAGAGRIGWSLQFGGALLSDWVVEGQRKAAL